MKFFILVPVDQPRGATFAITLLPFTERDGG
jgi:hypothetical protein